MNNLLAISKEKNVFGDISCWILYFYGILLFGLMTRTARLGMSVKRRRQHRTAQVFNEGTYSNAPEICAIRNFAGFCVRSGLTLMLYFGGRVSCKVRSVELAGARLPRSEGQPHMWLFLRFTAFSRCLAKYFKCTSLFPRRGQSSARWMQAHRCSDGGSVERVRRGGGGQVSSD